MTDVAEAPVDLGELAESNPRFRVAAARRMIYRDGICSQIGGHVGQPLAGVGLGRERIGLPTERVARRREVVPARDEEDQRQRGETIRGGAAHGPAG